MSEVHAVVGFAVVSVFAIGWLWPLGAFLLRRRPGDRYWIWLTIAQVVAGVQALIGLVLLLMGRTPPDWLHLVYGFGPLAILVIAHALAREGQKAKPGAEPIPPYLWFAFGAFVAFGLSLRALMTGLA
jgi:heme A synthase